MTDHVVFVLWLYTTRFCGVYSTYEKAKEAAKKALGPSGPNPICEDENFYSISTCRVDSEKNL
jgi:hypothetical protein